MRVLMKFYVRVVAALNSTYDKANYTETTMFCSRSEQMSEPVKKIAENTPLADIYYCEKTAMPESQGGESKEDWIRHVSSKSYKYVPLSYYRYGPIVRVCASRSTARGPWHVFVLRPFGSLTVKDEFSTTEEKETSVDDYDPGAPSST